jgi:hypothetical protein
VAIERLSLNLINLLSYYSHELRLETLLVFILIVITAVMTLRHAMLGAEILAAFTSKNKQTQFLGTTCATILAFC